MTSSRVIRPPPPVPTIWAAVRPCSRRSRRTAGVIRASASPTAGAAEAEARAGGRRVHRHRDRALVGAGGPLGRSRRRRRRGGCRRRRGRRGGGGSRLGSRGRGSRRRFVRRFRHDRCAGIGSRVRPGAVGRLDDRDLGVVRDGRALLDEDLVEGAFERRRDFGVDLVGDDLEERLVLGDVVAGLLEPLADRAFGDALAELGHGHLGHWSRSSCDGTRVSLVLVSSISASGAQDVGAMIG